jgi:hypothetical protein
MRLKHKGKNAWMSLVVMVDLEKLHEDTRVACKKL